MIATLQLTCPACGSGRYVASFGDMHGFCLVCDYSESPVGDLPPVADAEPTVGGVYLIHLARPYVARSGKGVQTVEHYIGWSEDIERRVADHQRGQGARILRVVRDAGISFDLVRTWPGEDRNFERKLKNQRDAKLLCPRCYPERRRVKAASWRAADQRKKASAK